MNSAKVLAATLAVALGLAATAVAQAQREPPPGAPPRGPGGPGGLERIIDELKLTDKQKEQTREVLKAHHEKMRKVLEKAREDLLKQLKPVLNEEQYNKMKEQLERMPPGPPQPPRGRGPGGPEGADDRPAPPGAGERPGRPGAPERPGAGDDGRGRPGVRGRRGPGGPGGLDRILNELKLTDQQKEKAREVLKANRERLLKEMKEVLPEDQFTRFKDQLEGRRPPEGAPGRRERPANP